MFAAEKMDAANVCCYDRKKELMSMLELDEL
jgi:hypothetical protein